VSDTIEGFKYILEGRGDDLSEQAFYMVGTLEDVHVKQKELDKKSA
jgi:F-type H+-transporting ATPase subunit beta